MTNKRKKATAFFASIVARLASIALRPKLPSYDFVKKSRVSHFRVSGLCACFFSLECIRPG